MTRFTFRITLSLATLLMALHTAAAQRLAVVDLETLVRAHPHTAADKAQLEETLRGYEAEGERLREHVDALRTAYEKAEADAANAALSATARQRAAAAAAEAQQTWAEARQDWRDQMQRLQQRLTEQEVRLLNRTVSELRREIGAHAEAEGITIVLDASDRRLGGPAGIVYADDSLDITDAILARIGATRPPEEPMPEDQP